MSDTTEGGNRSSNPRSSSESMSGIEPGQGKPSPVARSAGLDLQTFRSSAALKRTFSSLGAKSYRNLWIGFLLQMGGMQMLMMAGSYYIYELTDSASLLGVVTAASAVPALILALFGGVIADRLDKKRIIQAGQAVSLIVALFIALSISTDTITWVHFLVVSFVQGSVMPLMMPARQAIIPQLVDNDRLMNAVALNAMGMSLTTMLAPAVAGGLIAVLGMESVFFIIAGMYAGSVLFTGLLPPIETPTRSPSSTVLGDIKDGLGYVFSNRAIFLLIILSFATMVFAMPIRFILPIFAKDVFLAGPEGLGYMMSAMGVGSLVGALVIASLGNVKHRGFVLVSSGILSGSILLGFSAMSYWAPVYLVAVGFMVLIGLLQAGRMTLNSSLMMEYADQQYRGRVMSILTLSMALMPAGVIPVTLMADHFGAPLSLGTMATLLIIVACTVLLASPRLRHLD